MRSYDFVSWLLLAQVIRQDLAFGLSRVYEPVLFLRPVDWSKQDLAVVEDWTSAANLHLLLAQVIRQDLTCPVQSWLVFVGTSFPTQANDELVSRRVFTRMAVWSLELSGIPWFRVHGIILNATWLRRLD